jgi:hypothetical protein
MSEPREPPAAPRPAALSAPPARGWLVGPWFDLFFVANLSWPLLALGFLGDGFAGQSGLQFWQLYYITTPHRWVTLLLVFADRDRFRQRPRAFLAVAAAVVVACLGVRLTTGALTCLLAVDYVWNAWHFAAQHHGIYRVYGRLGGVAPTPGAVVEKWVMRLFLLYVILRVAVTTRPDAPEFLRTADWAAAAAPAWLVLRALLGAGTGGAGGRAYLVSVIALYLSLLWAVHAHRPRLVLALATASALFHAVEYLALVSWSVNRRHAEAGDRMGLLGYLAPRWGVTLAVFLLVLGAGGWMMDQELVETWLFVNVVVAFLHYAYDGMIWRRRGS